MWLVMGALKIWEKTGTHAKKEEKGELSLGPMVTSGWKSKDHSSPIEESVLLVGKSTGIARDHLRGFRTPHCWGWSDEVGGPTAILGQTATRGTSLAQPDGEIHEINALCPY